MLTTLPFTYNIRRSHRVANARIVVKPGLVEIVAPLQMPEHKLHKFVESKQQWVSQALKKMAASSPEQSGFAPESATRCRMLTSRPPGPKRTMCRAAARAHGPSGCAGKWARRPRKSTKKPRPEGRGSSPASSPTEAICADRRPARCGR